MYDTEIMDERQRQLLNEESRRVLRFGEFVIFGTWMVASIFVDHWSIFLVAGIMIAIAVYHEHRMKQSGLQDELDEAMVRKPEVLAKQKWRTAIAAAGFAVWMTLTSIADFGGIDWYHAVKAPVVFALAYAAFWYFDIHEVIQRHRKKSK